MVDRQGQKKLKGHFLYVRVCPLEEHPRGHFTTFTNGWGHRRRCFHHAISTIGASKRTLSLINPLVVKSRTKPEYKWIKQSFA